MYVKKDFLMIQSTKSYNTSMTTAKLASAAVGIDLQLRALTENKTSGLGFFKEDIEYPACYDRGIYEYRIFYRIW